MPLDPLLLEVLRCPACKGVLRALPADEGLACDACHRTYPIVDGIPNMIVVDAGPSR